MTKFRCCLAVLAVTAALALSGGVASAAPSDAQLRMRHQASDVPPVDVYLAGLNGQEQVVLKGLGYGQTSAYVDVKPGVYSVALRPAGAAASTTPAVKGTVEVSGGQAYTFDASGTLANLRQRLLMDGPAGVVPSAAIPRPGRQPGRTPRVARRRPPVGARRCGPRRRRLPGDGRRARRHRWSPPGACLSRQRPSQLQ